MPWVRAWTGWFLFGPMASSGMTGIFPKYLSLSCLSIFSDREFPFLLGESSWGGESDMAVKQMSPLGWNVVRTGPGGAQAREGPRACVTRGWHQACKERELGGGEVVKAEQGSVPRLQRASPRWMEAAWGGRGGTSFRLLGYRGRAPEQYQDGFKHRTSSPGSSWPGSRGDRGIQRIVWLDCRLAWASAAQWKEHS